MLSRLILFEISDAFAIAFDETQRLIPVAFQVAARGVDGVLQVKDVHVDRIGEQAIAAFFGEEKGRHRQHRAIDAAFVQAGKHRRRRAELEYLKIVRAHVPFAQHQLQHPVGRAEPKRVIADLLALQVPPEF